ncbi:MAG: hypothetical protein KGL04_07725 [Elusimicrobia bacterium]|nr:hypothetical protein [Elusimicrobiota bacterium]
MRQGFWGWGFLAAALAVPAFLFYRWREGMQGGQTAAISVIARGRLPSGGLFGKSPEQAKFQNPLDSSSGRAAVPAKTGGAAASGSPAQAAPAPAPAAETRAASPAPAQAQPAPMAKKAPASVPAVPTSADSAPAGYAVRVARDPMLSPADFKELRRMELEHERAEWLRLHPPKKRKKEIYRPPIESTVHLMGIITVQGNAEAIVNDTPVGAGGRIGKVRILRITKDSVVFGYGNKTFVKSMGK